MKFERCDHTVLRTSRFTSGWPEVKVAATSVTELMGTDSM